MKKKLSEEKVCESRTEYDLESLLPGGVEGKYVDRYRSGTNLVLLEPEIARAFPTQEPALDTRHFEPQGKGGHQ